MEVSFKIMYKQVPSFKRVHEIFKNYIWVLNCITLRFMNWYLEKIMPHTYKKWFNEFIVIINFMKSAKIIWFPLQFLHYYDFVSLSGMASVLRFCRHHPDYLLVEYKPLLQHVMKHVKNLRSQVMHVNVINDCNL